MSYKQKIHGIKHDKNISISKSSERYIKFHSPIIYQLSKIWLKQMVAYFN